MEQLNIMNGKKCPVTGKACYSTIGCFLCAIYRVDEEEIEENKKENGAL